MQNLANLSSLHLEIIEKKGENNDIGCAPPIYHADENKRQPRQQKQHHWDVHAQPF